MDPLPHSRRRSPHAVSVAELLCRYDTPPVVPRPRAEPVPAEPVPVSALLRREGRARRALDRPLVPRGHSRPDPAPVAAVPLRHGARKATAAAGALFVVGAVFGAGVLEEALLRPDGGAEPVDGFAADGSAGIGSGVDGVRDTGPGLSLASTAEPLPGVDLPALTGADIAAALAPGTRTVPDPRAPGSVPAAGAPAAVPGVGPGAPDPGTPDPGTPDPGPPDAGPPDPGTPDPVDPGSVAPSPVGPSPVGPGPPPVTVEVPDLGTPAVEIPAVVLPPTPLGPVATPSITVTEAAAVTPDVVVTVDEDGLGVGTTDTALDTPDAALGALDAGPVGLTGTGATLGDLGIEGAELLRVGPEPEITLPAATLTATEIETPDLRVGDAVVEVPDVALPELSTAEVPVVETVTRLLGRDSGDGDSGDGDSGDGDSGDGDSGDGDPGSDEGSDGGDSPLALVEEVPLVGGLLR